jgi:hypothetical protein
MALLYFTIQDKIVKNALDSIYCPKYQSRRETPIVVGGIAIQLHCPEMPDALRPTSDIDLLYLPEINNYLHFSQGPANEISACLRAKGYQVQLKKSRNLPLYEVKVMNGQGNKAKEMFFIHFDKVSPEIEKRTGCISEREAENAIEMQTDNGYALVKRIEDIVPYKIRRINRILNKNEEGSPLEKSMADLADQGKWSELANTSLEPWLTHLIDAQNTLEHGKKILPPSYVLSKDLFDICLLARKIEGNPEKFNRAYYAIAKQEVESM